MSEHLDRLTELDFERRRIEVRLRQEARNAYLAGVPKVDIARAAGISRPTLDKWLEDK